VAEAFELIAGQPLVSPQIFCHVFPFHLMFDRDMRIVQAGKSVSRVMPKVAEENCHLLDILEPIRPHIQLSFQTILSHISTIYVLKTKQDVMLEPDMFMRLKVKEDNENNWEKLIHPNCHSLQGQMMYIEESDLIMFQSYPSVMNLDDLTK
jgi:guanylate cyclase soluble subunit beta